MSRSATYIYCLVERRRTPTTATAPRGLPGAAAVEALEVGSSVWAIVAAVPLARYGTERLETHLRDINWVADLAVHHESVVEHFAADRGSTVVPMKLFTMFSSPERALADLRERRRDIATILRRVRGCQEWGVRITHGVPPSPVRRRPAAPTATGTAFLAAKRRLRDEAKEARARALDASTAAFDVLSTLARAAVLRQPPEGAAAPPLVDAAFLVPAPARARFRAAARSAAATCRAAGAELVLTGPWPPYTFVSTRAAGEPS